MQTRTLFSAARGSHTQGVWTHCCPLSGCCQVEAMARTLGGKSTCHWHLAISVNRTVLFHWGPLQVTNHTQGLVKCHLILELGRMGTPPSSRPSFKGRTCEARLTQVTSSGSESDSSKSRFSARGVTV